MEFLPSWSPGCPGEGRYQMTTNRRQSAAVVSSEEAAHFLLPLWTLMLGFFLLLCGIKGKSAILIFWITGRIWWLFHANGLFVFFLLSSTCLCSLFSNWDMCCPTHSWGPSVPLRISSVRHFRRQWLQRGLWSSDKGFLLFAPHWTWSPPQENLGPWRFKAKILLHRICLIPCAWLWMPQVLFMSVKPWLLCCVGNPSRASALGSSLGVLEEFGLGQFSLRNYICLLVSKWCCWV